MRGENPKAIQSPCPKHDSRTALCEQKRGRFANAAARARYCDDLAFCHAVLLTGPRESDDAFPSFRGGALPELTAADDFATASVA